MKKHPLADCENCPLNKGGVFVPSAGPAKADIAIVGEGPGKQEAKAGRPFTGPSGRLLNAVLEHHGIDREKVFLTNATLCRPYDGSTPPRMAIEACHSRLTQELRDRELHTVVALGNTAAQALLHSRAGITQLRVGPGRVSPDLPDVRIIPTVHPAACLRQSDMFPNIVADIGKVVRPRKQWTKPSWRAFDDVPQAVEALRQLRGKAQAGPFPLVYDIEVGIEKDTTFDHPNHYSMLCIGLSWASDKAIVIGEKACASDEVKAALKDLFLDENVQLIAHNGKFDTAGLVSYLGIAPKLFFDTMLAHYVLDERPSIHGLEYLGIEYLGTPDWKGVIHQYTKGGSYALVPRPILYEYNAYDVAVTYALYELFAQELEEESNRQDWPWAHLGVQNKSLRDVHDFLVRAGQQLVYIELNGMSIDKEYNDELSISYMDSLKPLEEELSRLAKKDYDKAGGLNPRSPKQLQEYLHDQGVRVPSTNEETMKLLQERIDPETDLGKFISTLLLHRREAKLYGTYVKGIRKRMYRGRVYPTFRLHGTTTGRLACRNPNLQNIPRESSIRRQFVPANDNNVFVQADYSQAELRVLTFLAQDEYFRSIFNDPSRDLFNELTPILYPGADKSKLGPAAWKELRIRVKAYVYGLSYGRSAHSIAQEYKLSVAEAQQGMDRFFEVIPDIVTFREEVKRKVRSNEPLITPFGRHRRFGLVTNDNVHDLEKEALAFLPQSTASDICLGAATELRPALRGKAYIRNIVHDSILVECNSDQAEEVGNLMRTVMLMKAEELVGDYVLFAADVEVGKSWGEL